MLGEWEFKEIYIHSNQMSSGASEGFSNNTSLNLPIANWGVIDFWFVNMKYVNV